jgi:anti-anti-sigma factor
MAGLRRSPTLEIDAQGGVLVITPVGDLRGDAVRPLHRALWAGLTSANHAVVVDLRQVSFLDKSSLQVLANAWREALLRDVGFMLVRPEQGVWALFAWTGLDLQLPSCFSLSRALAKLAAQSGPRPGVEDAPKVQSASREALICRDPETVFDYLAELEHAAEWRGDDFAAVTSELAGPARAGTRYRYVTRRTGTHGELIVDGLVRPHWLRCTSPPTRVRRLGGVWGSEEYVLFAQDGGTRLIANLEVHFSGPLRMAGPVLTGAMGARLGLQLLRLKNQVEA